LNVIPGRIENLRLMMDPLLGRLGPEPDSHTRAVNLAGAVRRRLDTWVSASSSSASSWLACPVTWPLGRR
jgi:hypothetical protein